MNNYRSVFEIIGPTMVGPSSSHTAGAVRIGQIARNLYGGLPQHARITLYGSFALTYSGHGTDVALISGILDFSTFDERIPQARKLADECGMTVEMIVCNDPVASPNTAKIELSGARDSVSVVGVSVGGGTIQIINVNNYDCRITGESPALLIFHQDRFGAIAAVTEIIAGHRINVAHLAVSRKQRGDVALMIMETDEEVSDSIIDELLQLDAVRKIVEVRV